MAKELLVVSDDTFTLEETENEDQFRFSRNDNEILKEITEEQVIDLFNNYIIAKMIYDDVIVEGNLYFDISEDGKSLNLIIEHNDKTVTEKKPSFLKRLFG